MKFRIFLTCIIFSLTACRGTAVETNPTATKDVKKKDSTVSATPNTPSTSALSNTSELRRVETLIGKEKLENEFQVDKPLLPIEEIGAKAVLAYTSKTDSLHFSIYEFVSTGLHEKAETVLSQQITDKNLLVKTATNGSLLFFGYAPQGKSADFDQLAHPLTGLVSAFAGEE